MIRAVDVTQHYGVRPVLREINLEIQTGELVAILGPNGMGKSTLLGVLAGILMPQKGYVEIDGLRRRASEDGELTIRRRTTFLPDHPWLPKNRTGRELLLCVGRLYEVDEDRLFDHVDRLLQLFELTREAEWPIRSYSNGQQKKIALCSSLVTSASYLLWDEPFAGGLDPSGIFALKHVLRRLTETRQATVVMTTPVPELLEELATRIVVLREGRIVACDTAEGLRRQTQCSGSLGEVLERLVQSKTLDNLRHYFSENNR